MADIGSRLFGKSPARQYRGSRKVNEEIDTHECDEGASGPLNVAEDVCPGVSDAKDKPARILMWPQPKRLYIDAREVRTKDVPELYKLCDSQRTRSPTIEKSITCDVS